MSWRAYNRNRAVGNAIIRVGARGWMVVFAMVAMVQGCNASRLWQPPIFGFSQGDSVGIHVEFQPSSFASYYDTDAKVVRKIYAPVEMRPWGLVRPSYEVEIADQTCRLRREVFGEQCPDQPIIDTVGGWDMIRLKNREGR